MTTQLPSSKEQLLADIEHAEEKAATLCGPCAEDHARLAGYLRALLAAHEQEPVAWWTGPEPTPTGEIESIHDHETGSHSIPLYANPAPVPAVPDEIVGWVREENGDSRDPLFLCGSVSPYEGKAYNSQYFPVKRAAMLNGGKS